MTTGVARVRYRVKGRPGVYVLPQQPEAVKLRLVERVLDGSG